MSTLQRLIAQAAMVIIGASIAFVLGYCWGTTATNDAWKARATDLARQQLRALEAEAIRADRATADHLAKQRSMEDAYATLAATHKDLLGRYPLVVAQRGACRPAVRAGAAAVGGQLVDAAPPSAAGGEPGATAPGGIEPSADVGDDGGSEPQLTLLAVRVWNNALLGADTPAGACGAAGAAPGADAACAQRAGLTVIDAWANHEANAKSCAEDRQRYRDLIEFITRSQPKQPGR